MNTKTLRVSLTVLLSLVLAACSLFRERAARYPAPDLAAIYGSSRENLDRNPVILIPGFAGSALARSADGRGVWGSFLKGDSLRPSTHDGLRAYALDIESMPADVDYRSVTSVVDDIEAVALVETMQGKLLGVKVDYQLYAPLLELFEEGGYVSAEEGGGAGEAIGPLYFTFFYDWRRDNVGNAQLLARFISEAQEEVVAWRQHHGLPARPVKFDVVAHSMGGLIARYYLRYGAVDVLSQLEPKVTWAGTAPVARLILVSTPNLGSTNALKDLVEGKNYPIYSFEPAMLATFPSFYQLLPREHQALWLIEEGNPVSPAFSSTVWVENSWGPFHSGQDKYLRWLFPSLASAAERKDRMAAYMDAAFERARRFAAALDRHPETPCPTSMMLFTGDSEKTLERVLVTSKRGRAVLKFKGPKGLTLHSPGDGTVTRASALAEKSNPPVAWDRTFFLSGGHASFLKNRSFHSNLLYILLQTTLDSEPAKGEPE